MINETTTDQKNAPKNWLRRTAAWIADHELWFLLFVALLLLFPSRWTPLTLLLIALTWLARWIAFGWLAPANPLNAPVLALFSLTLVGYLVAIETSLAQTWLRDSLLWTAVFFALVSSLRTERALLLSASTILLLGTGFALLGLFATNWDIVRLVNIPEIYDRLPRLFSDLPGLVVGYSDELTKQQAAKIDGIHPRQTGGLLGMLLPLATAILLFSQGWQWRLPAALFLLIGSLVLLLTQAPMGVFGFMLGLILIAIWWRPRISLALLIVLGIVLVLILYDQRVAVASAALDVEDLLGVGLVLRFDMWSRSLAMISDMPLTGVGLYSFNPMHTHFYVGHIIGTEIHAHNLLLQIVMNIGLPGLLAYFWLLVAFTVTSIRAYQLTTSRNLQVLLVGLSASMLSFVVGGLSDLLSPGLFWSTALLLGTVAATYVYTERSTETHQEPSVWRWTSDKRILLPTFLALMMVVLLFPTTRTRNWGLIWAHKALYQAVRTGTLPVQFSERAVPALNEVLAQEPERAQLYGTRASLYAWQGDQEAALADLDRRVDLDLRDPYGTYAPFVVWKAQVDGELLPSNEDSLVHVYGQWSNRYKTRAEFHVLLAMAKERADGDPAWAINRIEEGLEAGAEPRALLESYLQQLQEFSGNIIDY